MTITVPIAVVQKSGLVNAILAAELGRAGYRSGVDYVIVEYVDMLTRADDKLRFVFLGERWGTAADFETVERVRRRGPKPVFVASFHEKVLQEGGPCNFRVGQGTGDDRYQWLLELLPKKRRRSN